MRELTYYEHALVAGGHADETLRNGVREDFIDMSLIAAPFIGWELGKAATAGMGLAYGVGGAVAGIYVALVAVPVLTKVGLELAYGVHDILV